MTNISTQLGKKEIAAILSLAPRALTDLVKSDDANPKPLDLAFLTDGPVPDCDDFDAIGEGDG